MNPQQNAGVNEQEEQSESLEEIEEELFDVYVDYDEEEAQHLIENLMPNNNQQEQKHVSRKEAPPEGALQRQASKPAAVGMRNTRS